MTRTGFMTHTQPHFSANHFAQKLAYRPCIGIALFNSCGHVFIGKRIQKELPPHTPLWQLPQGGVDENETPMIAAFRELEEETGITKAHFMYELPDWLAYDLPEDLVGVALKGKFRGQKQKWFAMRFDGKDSDIDLNTHNQAEFSDWAWRSLDDCVDLVVPFKRHIYAELAVRLKFLSEQSPS